MEVPQSREEVEEAQNDTYAKQSVESVHVRYTIGTDFDSRETLDEETAKILAKEEFREDFPNEFSTTHHKVFAEDAGMGQFNVHIIG